MSTPGRPVHRRPFLRALAISLLVHAALVAWLLRPLETAHRWPPVRPATRITLRPAAPASAGLDPHRPPSPARRTARGAPAAPSHRLASPAGSPASPPRLPLRAPGAAHALARCADPALSRWRGRPRRRAGPATGHRGVHRPRRPRQPRGRGRSASWSGWRRCGATALAERLVATGVDDYFKDYRRALQSHMGSRRPVVARSTGTSLPVSGDQRLARRAGGGELAARSTEGRANARAERAGRDRSDGGVRRQPARPHGSAAELRRAAAAAAGRRRPHRWRCCSSSSGPTAASPPPSSSHRAATRHSTPTWWSMRRWRSPRCPVPPRDRAPACIRTARGPSGPSSAPVTPAECSCSASTDPRAAAVRLSAPAPTAEARQRRRRGRRDRGRRERRG